MVLLALPAASHAHAPGFPPWPRAYAPGAGSAVETETLGPEPVDCAALGAILALVLVRPRGLPGR